MASDVLRGPVLAAGRVHAHARVRIWPAWRSGDRVYAIGGHAATDSVIPRRAVEAYDVMGDTWLTGFSPLPVPRLDVGGADLMARST